MGVSSKHLPEAARFSVFWFHRKIVYGWVAHVTTHVDDFFGVVRDEEMAERLVEAFTSIAARLGVRLKTNKTKWGR